MSYLKCEIQLDNECLNYFRGIYIMQVNRFLLLNIQVCIL